MSTRPSRPSGKPASVADNLERLYFYGLVAVIILALAIFLLAILSASQIRSLSSRLEEQRALVAELSARLEQFRSNAPRESASATPGLAPSKSEISIQRPESLEQPSPRQPPATSSAPAAEDAPDVATQPVSAPPAAADLTDDDALASEIDRFLDSRDPSAAKLSDDERSAARQLLSSAGDSAANAARSGQLWARLALIARLADEPGRAELLAVRARQSGVFPEQYLDQSLRDALAEGRSNEAGVFARRLMEQRDLSVRTRLTLGEWRRALGDFAGAENLFDAVLSDASAEIGPLRPARLAVWLERWPEFERLSRLVADASVDRSYEALFVKAVRHVRAGEFVEGLAILDHLLEGRPADYEILLWRGIALSKAGQLASARQALRACETVPSRPEGWYWAGIVEQRRGDLDAAELLFQRSLAVSARYAPALEALGLLNLERAAANPDRAQRLADSGLESLQRAVEFAPRRASAHWQLAVAHAGRGSADLARKSLQAALSIDPALAGPSKQSAALSAVASEDEISAWSAPSAE